MKKLAVCVCPHCPTQFMIGEDDLEEGAELTCPICQGVFLPDEDGEEDDVEDVEGDGEFDEESEEQSGGR